MFIFVCGDMECRYDKEVIFSILNSLNKRRLLTTDNQFSQLISEWSRKNNNGCNVIKTLSSSVINNIELVVVFPGQLDPDAINIVNELRQANKKILEVGRRVYVDMDDVLVDFHTAYKKKKEQLPKKKPVKLSPGFFLNLTEIPGAIQGINRLAEFFEVWILSAPFYHVASCYTEKRLWVEEHLGEKWYKKLILCPDKNLLIGDYLIDDNLWKDFCGTQLQFGTREFPNWYTVLDYFGIQKDE